MKSAEEMANDFAINTVGRYMPTEDAFLAGFSYAIEMLRSEEAAKYLTLFKGPPDRWSWADWLEQKRGES